MVCGACLLVELVLFVVIFRVVLCVGVLRLLCVGCVVARAWFVVFNGW